MCSPLMLDVLAPLKIINTKGDSIKVGKESYLALDKVGGELQQATVSCAGAATVTSEVVSIKGGPTYLPSMVHNRLDE